jgi:YVTN family beta-propeller protein
MENGTVNPYVGPRPFERKERDLFFGRDRESIQIISLILSNPLVLIYSQSGAGKTSLFNTKITYELEQQYKFQTFPSARVSSLLSVDRIPENVDNMYIFNTLQSLKPDADPEILKKQSLSGFLKSYSTQIDTEAPPSSTINQDSRPNNIRRIIVFDQLEELFGLYPENWHQQQQEFFREIAEALNEDDKLRIVFIIREEYLAHISSFAHLLIGKLRARFRLEPLKRDAALLAVTQPIKSTGVNFAQGVAEELVDNLTNIHVEDVFHKPTITKGEYVEPVHLQVVCQRLWNKVVSQRLTQITHDQLGDVDARLKEFYEEAVHDTAKETKIKEQVIRDWCENKLITTTGTRSIIHQESNFTGGLSNKAVSILENKYYLIRAEGRSGATWIELTHDRLIEPIKNSNNAWRIKQTEHERKKKNLLLKISIPSVIVSIILIVILFSSYYAAFSSRVTVDQPVDVSVNPKTNIAYVANLVDNTISVIGGKTNTVITNIQVGAIPLAVSVNPETNVVYVANSESKTVSVINGTTNTVITNIQVGATPTAISVNPSTNIAYISNFADNTVSVINGKTNTVTATIKVGSEPDGVGINPSTNIAYVANRGDKTVSVINGTTNTVIKNIKVLEGPSGVGINRKTNMVYVTDSTANAVSVIDGKTNTVKATIPVGIRPYGISINPSTNIAYVANRGNNTVSVINGKTNTVTSNITVATIASNFYRPLGVSVNPAANIVYVATFYANTVSVIDGKTNTVTATISGKKPVCYSPFT